MSSRMDKYSPTRAELRSMEGQWRVSSKEEREKERRMSAPCLLVRVSNTKAALISKRAC